MKLGDVVVVTADNLNPARYPADDGELAVLPVGSQWTVTGIGPTWESVAKCDNPDYRTSVWNDLIRPLSPLEQLARCAE